MSLYQFSVKNINNEEVSLDVFKGKVLLIVNTASACGFTPQYEGLEKLYSKYKDQGFEVLGFPCNQFGNQEPGDEKEISSFCSLNYQTTFPLFSKIEVNGENTHPLYSYLKEQAPGVMGSKAIKWNFTKFLIDRTGTKIQRFASATKPEKMEDEIIKFLSA